MPSFMHGQSELLTTFPRNIIILLINLLFISTVLSAPENNCAKMSSVSNGNFYTHSGKKTLFIFLKHQFKDITAKNTKLLKWGNLLFMFKINLFSPKDFQNTIRGKKMDIRLLKKKLFYSLSRGQVSSGWEPDETRDGNVILPLFYYN